MKYYYLLLLFFVWISPVFSQFVSEIEDDYIIQTDYVQLVLSKSNGMLTSGIIKDTDFELSSDYADFSLFFTEFALQYPNDNLEIFTTSNRKTHQGTVEITDYYLKDNFFRIQFTWTNQYIVTKWSYHFFKDRKYLVVNLDREVRTSWVYSNHQQCVMANPDFDNFYQVNYENEWFQVMDKGNVGPFAHERAANFQHTVFAAHDKGKATRFPAFGWYLTERDLTWGIVVTSVSPNQRATFAYHGAGRTKYPRHPGFSEVQYDWFGKADSEALYLKKGTQYSMQMVYYFSKGAIDSLDNFNLALFNESHYDSREHENYAAASWGGRHVYLAEYSWTFPQASNNFICSQELFNHRGISIPRSQNGEQKWHLFDVHTIAEKSSDTPIDLTPLPVLNDGPLLHQDAYSTHSGEQMQGTVVWEVDSLNHKLTYEIFETSDKLTVYGEIQPTAAISVKKLYVELPFTPRISEVKKISDQVWDIRADDSIWEVIGVTLYDTEGILRIDSLENRLQLVIFEAETPTKVDSSFHWHYSFKLFPHREHNVDSEAQITPFFDLPEEYYRDYYQSFSELGFDNQYGFRADNRLGIISVQKNEDPNQFLTITGYAEKGNYPIYFYFENENIGDAQIDGWFNAPQQWIFDSATRVLTVQRDWDGVFKLALYRERLALSNFNISFNSTENKATISWDANFATNDAVFEIFRRRGNRPAEQIFQSKLPGNQYVDSLALPYGEFSYSVNFSYAGRFQMNEPVEARFPVIFDLFSPNFPNPFNSATKFCFEAKSAGHVTIRIFNVQGQLVKILKDEYVSPDVYTIVWDGTDRFKTTVPSGVYFVQMQAGGQITTQKVILMR